MSAAAEPIDEPNTGVAVEMLRQLDPDGWHNLVAIGPNREAPVGRTFPPHSWKEMQQWIENHNGQRNLYFSVNEPVPAARNDKLSKRDIARIRAIYVDLDPRKGLDLAEERARLWMSLDDYIDDKTRAPTWVVDSGGGYQAFWKLDEKMDAKLHGSWAENQGRSFARHFGGDGGVHNVDRIMRLPGTLNVLSPAKRAAGRKPAPARLVASSDLKYSPGDLRAIAPPVAQLSAAKDADNRIADVQATIDMEAIRSTVSVTDLPNGLRQKFQKECAGNTRLQALWEGAESALGNDKTGSGYRGMLARYLRGSGRFDAQEFGHLLWVWDFATPAGDPGEKINARQIARDWIRMGRVPGVEEFSDVQSELWAAHASAQAGAINEPGKLVCPADLSGIEPPQREWLVEDLIPRGEVVFLTGDGGLGKSLLMQQLLTSVATGSDWLGRKVQQGPAFAMFCEDDAQELHRRQTAIDESMWIDFTALENVQWWIGKGVDCTLMTFQGSDASGALTRLYSERITHLASMRPALVVVDTLTDTFGGNEVIRRHARTFINVCLGGICRTTGATVILCGHPSRAGQASGDGLSGSTHWHNSVRSRLYLTGAKDKPDERTLETMKQNYGPRSAQLRLLWSKGVFRPIGKALSDPAARAAAAEDAYIAALRQLTSWGENVVLARNQQHYAPRRMKDLDEAGGFGFKDLEVAQRRLLSSGKIRQGEKGPPSKRSRFIVENQVANPLQ